MYKLMFVLFVGGCILSCSQKTDDSMLVSFPEYKKLKAERILMETILYPDFIALKENYLFISSSKSDTLVSVFKTPEISYIRSFGIKGGGVYDFDLYPMFCTSFDTSLYIWGYTPLKINKFKVDQKSDLIFNNSYYFISRESFNQMHIIKDSILIYSAIPSEFSIKKYDVINEKYLGKIKIEEDDHDESFFYSNRGVMAANDSLILYAYIYKKQIDFYDIEQMHLKKTIKGPGKTKIVINEPANNIKHYIRIVSGKKFVYALYMGFSENQEGTPKIEVFDYNGNPILCYELDILPSLFEVDEENGYLYGFNQSMEDYLLRYKLSL